MNRNSKTTHARDERHDAPTHPAGMKASKDDAETRMTGEGDAQNPDDAGVPASGKKNQGGQGPGQGRGANPGEVHASRNGGARHAQDVEQRSKNADAGVADEQEGHAATGTSGSRRRVP